MSDRRQILESLSTKEYRDLYVSEVISSTLAAQIKAMREGEELTQGGLGELAQMAQESISKLENPDYGRYTLSTLKRLASALDVALTVRFTTFGELSDWIANLGPDQLAPMGYLEEQASGASAYFFGHPMLAENEPEAESSQFEFALAADEPLAGVGRPEGHGVAA